MSVLYEIVCTIRLAEVRMFIYLKEQPEDAKTERFNDSRKRSNPNKVVWVIYICKLRGRFFS